MNELTKQQEKFNVVNMATGSTDYLPNLTLVHGSSTDLVAAGCKPGNYALHKTDIGKNFPIVVLAHRFHAILWENGEKTEETYDAFSPITTRIKALKKDYPVCDPQYGLSWLVYLPNEKEFAIFHPNSPSARRVSKGMHTHFTPPKEREKEVQKKLLHTNMFNLTSASVKGKKFTYLVPDPQPIEPDINLVPTKEEIEVATPMFTAPIKAEGTVTEATESTPER